MISFIVVIIVAFAAREFYYLAISFNKNRFLYGFVGVVSYFLGIFIGTFVITLVAPQYANSMEAAKLGGMLFPAGALTALIVYFALRRSWSR